MSNKSRTLLRRTFRWASHHTLMIFFGKLLDESKFVIADLTWLRYRHSAQIVKLSNLDTYYSRIFKDSFRISLKLIMLEKIDYGLTLRRPRGKVTPRRPCRRARRFQWRNAPTVLKLAPRFSMVLKTINSLLNPKFISEIASN